MAINWKREQFFEMAETVDPCGIDGGRCELRPKRLSCRFRFIIARAISHPAGAFGVSVAFGCAPRTTDRTLGSNPPSFGRGASLDVRLELELGAGLEDGGEGQSGWDRFAIARAITHPAGAFGVSVAVGN